jgi:ABC-type transport system involved in multi-copper enzyme maturation permease subunit
MRLWPSYPLLGKELIEAAVRRRTYILRTLYALVLLAGFALVYREQSAQTSGYLTGMLGSGRHIFIRLFYWQSIAILIIMPAVTATAITAEKEAGTLTSLLLTAISPTALLMQKWFSRLILVGSYLLLSVPLLGVAYAYGGLSADVLINGVYLLILSCLQASAVALMASAFFRSSLTAFVMSYVLLGLLYCGGEIYNFTAWVSQNRPNYYPLTLFRGGGSSTIFPSCLVLEPPVLFTLMQYHLRSTTLARMCFESLPIIASVLASLAAARFFFVRRAHIEGMNPLLSLFRKFDRIFERADAAIGRKAPDDIPVTDPVAWREFNRRSLANLRYLMRIMLPIGGALAIGVTWVFSSAVSQEGGERFLSYCVLGVFAFAILIMAAVGASLVAGERVNQTLDVLLTTPMSARDILRQKARGLRRLHYAIIILLGVLMVLRWFASSSEVLYESILVVGINAVVLPALFSWFSIWIGLRSRNRNRAVIVAVIASCAWIFSVFLLAMIYRACDVTTQVGTVSGYSLFATPAALLAYSEHDRSLYHNELMVPLIIFLACHVPMLWYLRRRCYANADRYLRGSRAVR